MLNRGYECFGLHDIRHLECLVNVEIRFTHAVIVNVLVYLLFVRCRRGFNTKRNHDVAGFEPAL